MPKTMTKKEILARIEWNAKKKGMWVTATGVAFVNAYVKNIGG